MAKHPGASKRLGAALAINSIYVVFRYFVIKFCMNGVIILHVVIFCREEDPLVDMFVIEMLVVMIESLRLAHRDDKSLGTYIIIIICRCIILFMMYMHVTGRHALYGWDYIHVHVHVANHTPLCAGTREQACLSIDHLCRIIKVKSSKLVTPSRTRRIPK